VASQGVPVISNPKYRSRNNPKYPRLAKRRGIQGTVIIRANVTPQGRVSHAKVHQSSGNLSLDRSALSSVKQWIFEPAQRNGKTIASIVQVPVNFQLN
jgi:protein TonB